MNMDVIRSSVVKLLKFLVIFILVDQGLGLFTNQLFKSQETGKYARSTYVIDKSNDDVLIFGSSHAIRHYVPSVIEDKTGLSCYNAGAEGQQLLYQTALLQMVLKRTTPKFVVLNIDEHWLYESDVAYSRLNDLNPYYGNNSEILRPKFEQKSLFVPIKMVFNAFQENSTLVHIVRYFFAPQYDQNGYKPLYGKMKGASDKKPNNETLSESIDPFLVENLKLFIATAKEKNVKLLFITSPYPEKNDYSNNKSFQLIKQIGRENQVPFYDYLNDERFVGNYEMFNDPTHINHDAAVFFTGLVADHISEELSNGLNDFE